jgi:hypothetical protein
MSGKLPIDRVPGPQDQPRIQDEHRERFTRQQAAIRDSDGPVAGARPPTDTPATDPPTAEAHPSVTEGDADAG